MIPRTATQSHRDSRPGLAGQGLLTVPNVLCAVRLAGSPVLVWLGWAGMPGWCLGLFVFLSLTDWLDGKLAKLLGQQSEFGARLDTVADVTFYSCTALALAGLRGDLCRQEAVWIGLAAGSYVVSVAAALTKYRRAPAYHTRMARTSWLLAFVAVVAVFADWSVWVVRLALLGVFITNVEAILITLTLPDVAVGLPDLRGPPAPTTNLRRLDPMTVIPLNDKILVERVEAEEKTAGGIVLPDTAKEKPKQGKVLSTGEGKVLDNGKRQPFQVKVGDRVLFTSYAGSEIKVDGKEYLVMSEEDILAVVS